MDVAYDKQSSPQPDSFLSGGGENGGTDQCIRLVENAAWSKYVLVPEPQDDGPVSPCQSLPPAALVGTSVHPNLQ
jgi:hypothetical protein